MHLTAYIGIVILILAIGMMVFISRSSKENNRPHLFSLVAFGLIVLHWALYLFNFYATIPESIANIIFLPAWILVSVVGFVAAYKEFGNNRTFSLINSGLSIISFVVTIPLWVIGNM